eukprot:CAMPEP_0170555142 /NCGR_PEP_ID=MMETSP0211-20121228/13026_1 /TAXON_ID=311385 /ORGANISM="Pseudokeronopsis sp., Strain OXSARD2" /LENGTH=63 /DNA_ID=CAMNT_0010864755 /DNA_START=227 /DNA_END=418 /DNA_ORIENTATION=-
MRGDDNANANNIFTAIFSYYNEVKDEMKEYSRALDIIEDELKDVQTFSDGKVQELEDLIPYEQ